MCRQIQMIPKTIMKNDLNVLVVFSLIQSISGLRPGQASFPNESVPNTWVRAYAQRKIHWSSHNKLGYYVISFWVILFPSLCGLPQVFCSVLYIFGMNQWKFSAHSTSHLNDIYWRAANPCRPSKAFLTRLQC